MTENDFILVHSEEIEDSASGHGTSVRRRKSLTADYVEKTINPDGSFKESPDTWAANNAKAKKISDQIRAKGNSAYIVPKTFIRRGKVREIAADKILAKDLPREFLFENADWLIPAMGNFINDMSELRHTRAREAGKDFINGIGIGQDGREGLKKILESVPEIVSENAIKTALEAYDYLSGLPENHEMVFAHNDLHGGNVFVDPDKKTVTIIDFELAGYTTKLHAMYGKNLTAWTELWEYINKLPRTTNPGFKWNFDKDIATMVQTMGRVAYTIRKYKNSDDKSNAEKIKQQIEDDAKRIYLILGKKKVEELQKHKKEPEMTMALAPMSHYEK